MRIGVILAAIMGLALAGYLIFYVGFGPILAAITAVGWGGFALLCLYGASLFALLGTAWFILIPARDNPDLVTFIWGRAVRDCAGEVLPFSQVGGMVIGARAAMLRGLSGPLAFASTVVDITVEMMAEIAFVLAGLAILVTRVPPSAASGQLVRGIAIGLTAAALGAAVFVVLQRKSFSTVVCWMTRLLPEAAGRAGAIQHSFAELYESPMRLAFSLAIHLTGWLATALWAWFAVRLIGKPVSLSSIVAIEANSVWRPQRRHFRTRGDRRAGSYLCAAGAAFRPCGAGGTGLVDPEASARRRARRPHPARLATGRRRPRAQGQPRCGAGGCG